MVIHCIPMPKRDAAVAPGYFKKTLSEAGSEWGQHRKVRRSTTKKVSTCVTLFAIRSLIQQAGECDGQSPRTFPISMCNSLMEHPLPMSLKK